MRSGVGLAFGFGHGAADGCRARCMRRLCFPARGHAASKQRKVNEMSEHQIPEEIRLQNGRAALTLVYGGEHKSLPAEFLRVYSPSAEVRGHAPGQEVLQTGKAGVTIMGLEPVGQYALKITFSDGHDSGLYDWPYLYKMAYHYDEMWDDYLRRIESAGASRIPNAEDLAAQAKGGHSCGGGSCGCSR